MRRLRDDYGYYLQVSFHTAIHHKRSWFQLWVNKVELRDDDVETTIPCTDTSDRETYLNKPEVREALHVAVNVTEWLACR